MRGYGRYNRWRGTANRPSQTDRLSGLLGNAVGQIKAAFLALGSDELNGLLDDYGALYGESAESYARKIFPEWKSGSTKLSGQTMQRLINLVPPYLSAAARFDLLQEVLKKQPANSAGRSYKNVRINSQDPTPGFAELDAALQSMNFRDSLANIEERAMNIAKWLYDDDMTAVRAMLAEVESRKNEIIKTSARREIDLLRRTVQSGQVKKASYNVQMPSGRLSVEVFTPNRSIWKAIFG